MRRLDAALVRETLDPPSLVDALAEGFRQGAEVPPRHHHTVQHPSAAAGTLLLMPAWQVGGFLGVKVVTVFPGNGELSLPAVMGIYLLADATNGTPKALIDGPMLTLRRTACASALAARFLARKDARRMVMVGTGALAPHLIEAHCAVRPIEQVQVWGRDAAKARALAAEIKLPGVTVTATEDLAGAVGQADLVSCATLSKAPVVQGAWLKPGAHLDLVGAYTPQMREADDEAVRRSRVYVDTLEACPREGGDIAQPLANGTLSRAQIQGDLFQLCRGEVQGRRTAEEITFFKSVGHALEDLVAAVLLCERCRAC